MKDERARFRRRARAAALALPLILLPLACSRDRPDGDGHAGEAAREEHAEERDAHGSGLVALTPAQVEQAGIVVEPAAPGRIAHRLTMPAVVAANADAVTHVNPKAPGIVRSIHKHLGEKVEEGDLLSVIDSVELGNAVADFVRARALVAAAETTLEREQALFEQRLDTAERVLDGAIEVNRRIHAREAELQEKAVSTIRPLLEAEKALRAAELEKERELTDLWAERDTRLLALEVDLTERRIGQEAAQNALLALGLDASRLETAPPDPSLVAGRYEIRAPRAGIVAGRHITAGEFVDSQTKLFTLEDLSRVWVMASAFEEEIQSVRTGRTGRVRLDAFPQQVFEGVVALVGYEVDPESRALGVRLELENPTLSGWAEEYPIRPGMFGSVDLVVEEIEARVVLPEQAVVHEDEGDFVFVLRAPGTFERRPVELGPPAEDVVEVVLGLEPGEEVAVSGTFHLKSASRKGELGGGHDH